MNRNYRKREDGNFRLIKSALYLAVIYAVSFYLTDHVFIGIGGTGKVLIYAGVSAAVCSFRFIMEWISEKREK